MVLGMQSVLKKSMMNLAEAFYEIGNEIRLLAYEAREAGCSFESMFRDQCDLDQRQARAEVL